MYSVAIVGATGIVGRQLVELLAERNFPINHLGLFASDQSLGEFLEFNDDSVPVHKLEDGCLKGLDIAFFCAGIEVSKHYCPQAAAAGVVCIDTSGAFSGDDQVPLVVPEINPQRLRGLKGGYIIASPCSASIQLSLPLHALRGAGAIRRVVVSTYQAVSQVGQRGVDELRAQSGELLNGRPFKHKVYPQQVAFNCLPQIGEFIDGGYTTAEMNIVAETRKILADESLAITLTAVTVPVFYGSCQSVNVVSETKLSVQQVRELLQQCEGLDVVDDVAATEYPMPVMAADQDVVLLGRIRSDNSIDGGLNLWSAMDDIRKGGATNAVQIAELLAGGKS